MDVEFGVGSILHLPAPWQELRSLPDDPPGTRAFGYQGQTSEAMLLMTPVEEGGYFMPFDQVEVIRSMRPALAKTGAALIAVESGKTANGSDFVYTIVKGRMDPVGVQYTLTLHAELPARVQIQGFFSERGATGVRDATVLELKRRDGSVRLGQSGLEGWMRDPYDDSAERTSLRGASTTPCSRTTHSRRHGSSWTPFLRSERASAGSWGGRTSRATQGAFTEKVHDVPVS